MNQSINNEKKPIVGIVMGSDSDLSVMKNAGLLVARILGLQNLELYNKLTERANQIKETLIFDLSEKLEACLNFDDIETNEIK